jgi:hypothetical protein
MRTRRKLSVLAALLLTASAVLVFGKIRVVRDDSGGTLLWNSTQAYLFMDVHRRGFHITYLEYPWVILKESLYGVREPDNQRTSVVVIHLTASAIEKHVVEMAEEHPGNTPVLYTPFDDFIYANCGGYLCKWNGNKFETATEDERHRLDGTNGLVAKDIDQGVGGWSKHDFGEAVTDYEFAVDADGKFALQVTNKLMGQGGRAILSVTLTRPGQAPEGVWHCDGRPRRVSKAEYRQAFGQP